jgi:hypothetical protein
MLYIGHFSFDEVNITGLARHGYFTLLTEADSAEAATAAFKTTIEDRKRTDPIFESILAVYIEDIIEIPALPKTPIMTRLQSAAGQFPESVSHTLPGVDREDIKAYAFAIDVMQLKIKPTHDYKEMTPFIRF